MERVVQAIIDGPGPTTAGYLSVRQGDRALDVALGTTADGRPASPADLAQMFCTTKPLLPLLLAASAPHLLDGTIDVGPVATDDGVVEEHRLVVTDLLTHTSGLSGPSSLMWRFYGLEVDDPVVLGSLTFGDRPTYSDFAAWVLLEALFRSESGRDPADAIRQDLLLPLGLDDDVFIALRHLPEERRADIGVAVGRVDGVPVPFLSEALPSELDLLRPSFGSLATMRGLADLMAAVGTVMGGRSVDGLPPPHLLASLLARRGPHVDDPEVGRDLCFAGGFMANHAATPFLVLSPATVGHLGGVTPCGAAYDPERDLAVAFYLNGTIASRDEMRDLQQQVLAGAAAWADR